MHADAYVVTPADGRARSADLVGNRAAGGAWPVRSGLVPPVAEGFVARTETVPGLEAALAPGATVALVTGLETAGGRQDWPGPCGKTQLAAYVAGALWRSRSVDVLAWVGPRAGRRCCPATYRPPPGWGWITAVMPRRWRPAWWPGWAGPAGRGWWCWMTCEMRRTWRACGRPGRRGRVLITAADAAVVSGAARVLVLAVPAFSTREALSYLSGRLTTDPDQRSGAIDLAAGLGCEPAALAQAAAVIISSGIRCREYRDYFVQRQAQPAAGGDEPTAAWFTWTVAASHARADDHRGGLGQRSRLAAKTGGQVDRAAALVRVRGQPARQVAQRLPRAEPRHRANQHPGRAGHHRGVRGRDQHPARRPGRPQALQVRRVSQVIEHHQPRPAGPAQPGHQAGRHRLGITAVIQPQLGGGLYVAGEHRCPARGPDPGQNVHRA